MTAEEAAGDVKWERWQKKRVFVREVAGKYGELYRSLLEQPRVFKSKDMKWKGGPTKFGKNVVNPQATQVTQAIETHIDVLAPGSYGQRHGHINSAVFFILSGKGYDVHDGVRIDWEEGDAAIVENACVHQHFNADPDHEARILVFKAKPTFLFFNLLFQKNVVYPPSEPMKGFESFQPEG
ncbi:MAG: cupin domain-containing protein [Chloroflexi bacterium]|nr:cupin domain-containing protein [Chloroflexota bacterium]MCL5952297.1 cupin domain-containing protein [Chloroflexota bacterium]